MNSSTAQAVGTLSFVMLRSRDFCSIIAILTLSLIIIMPASAAKTDTPNSLSPHGAENIRRMFRKAVNSKDTVTLKKLLKEWPEYATEEYPTGKTLLRIAIRGGSSEVVKMLLNSNSSNIDLRDRSGFTPLMAAAVWKNYAIVKILIESGADLNIQDNMGNTALFRALFTRNNDILTLLVKGGANVNIPNDSGITPLMMVKGTEQEVIMQKLLKERKE